MKILIIGGDPAGLSAANQIRRRQPEWQVTILDTASYSSQAARRIPSYLAGEIKALDDLVVVTPPQVDGGGIDIRTGWQGLELDVEGKRVTGTTAEGERSSIPYDELLLTTGALAVEPEWKGRELQGVGAVKGVEYVERLERRLREARRCVLIGAGRTALEMAEALQRRDLHVVIMDEGDRIMEADPRVTHLIADELKRHGVELRLETAVRGFAGRDGVVAAVETDQGPIPSDVAILTLGLRPNVELAREAGVPLGSTGAIAVDSRQRTRLPHVFAAGDCAEAFHRVLEKPVYQPSALTANRQGRVAGTSICGGRDRFPGIVGTSVTQIFELTVARTGIVETEAREAGIPCESLWAEGPGRARFLPGQEALSVKLVYRSDDHRLLGACLVGRDEGASKRCDVLATALSAGLTIEEISDLDLTYIPPLSPVWDPILQAANEARQRFEG